MANCGATTSGTSDAEAIGRDNLTTLLAVLREGIQRQDGIADRLDAKTRQLLALIGLVYAIVQTIAFGSYRQGHLGGSERLWIAILALAALGSVVVSIYASFIQQKPVEVEELNPKGIEPGIDNPNDPAFLSKLCRDHLAMLYSRRKANATRQIRLNAATLYSGVTVLLIGAELVIAVIARIS